MMKNSQSLPFLWWFKFSLTVFAILFGLCYTIPTFFPKFLHVFLPENKINLGLDLKGGLSLSLDVETNKAVKESIARALTAAKESAREAGINTGNFQVNENFSAHVDVKNPDDVQKFQKKVLEQTMLLFFGKYEQGKIYFEPNKNLIAEFQKQIMRQAVNTIRNRIDQFGVAEPNIFQSGENRIVVELPGMTDIEHAKQLLGNTAQLDFRIVSNKFSNEELNDFITQAKTALKIDVNNSQPETYVKISQWLRDQNKIPQNFTILVQKIYDTEISNLGAVVAIIPYLVELHPKLTGDMIEDAQAGQSTENYVPTYIVSLKFKPIGTKLFGDLTTEVSKPDYKTHQIAIVLDGNVQSAPGVNNGPILGGNAQITMGSGRLGEKQLREAQDLALVLRAGALPASIKFVEERQIGPSEGAQNIRSGIISTVIAAVIVILLMVVIYGVSGIVANIAMFLNILLILAFMALVGATLTLPGIAGIVLTMAIAVDGNVVINERIREEIRSGLKQKQAFYKGYQTSFRTLIDAHITSAVAGIVLIMFGNPTIKGFAVTLLCGIICTLFTSYYVTEVIGQWLIEKTQIKRFG